MVEANWPDVAGEELRYLDRTWTLTGTVDVQRNGDLIAAEATRADGVRHERATLYFGLENPPDSPNPGNQGVHFDRVERGPDGQFLVVREAGRTYRYELHRLEYA